MARLLPQLLAVFALFLAPALCMGGLVEHSCDCGEVGVEESCEHEASCSDDPCESIAVAPEQDESGQAAQHALLKPACGASGTESLHAACCASPRSPPDRSSLPYAQSDRPLRI